MTLQKHITTFLLSLVAAVAVGAFFAQTTFASEFPSTYRVVIDHTDNDIFLLGNSDSTGLSTVISLPESARFIHTEQFRKGNLNYLVVLHTNAKQRKVYLKLYHPDTTQLASMRILETNSSKRFSSVRLETKRVDGKTQMLIKAIKQGNNGTTKLYQKRRFIVQPSKQKKLKRTLKKNALVKPPTTRKTGDKATLEWMNYYRKRAGLLPVAHRKSLSSACKKHVTYMESHGLTHVQDSSKSGYTTEGAEAGLASDLAQGTDNMLEAFGLWLAGPYHRFPIFEPTLTHVGMNYQADEEFSCLHLGTMDTDSFAFPYSPVRYPSPGAKNVPTTFNSGESPDPLEPHGGNYPAGQVVSIGFRSGVEVESMTVMLTDANGASVSGYTQLPGDSADPNTENQRNSVTFIPRSPLSGNTRYTVRMSGIVDGSNFSKSWKFTTE